MEPVNRKHDELLRSYGWELDGKRYSKGNKIERSVYTHRSIDGYISSRPSGSWRHQVDKTIHAKETGATYKLLQAYLEKLHTPEQPQDQVLAPQPQAVVH